MSYSADPDFPTGMPGDTSTAFVPGIVPVDVFTMKLNTAAPILSITSPPANLRIERGTSVTLEGATTGEPISWSCWVDGSLGQGNKFTTGPLSAGSHLITASSTNTQNGLTGLTGVPVRAWSEVSIQATDPDAAEGGDNTGEFTVTRSSDYGELTVLYSIGGSAANGADYDELTGSVTFLDTELAKSILVTPVQDGVEEGDETVVLTLELDDAFGFERRTYKRGSPNSATVTIVDNSQQPSEGRAVSETAIDDLFFVSSSGAAEGEASGCSSTTSVRRTITKAGSTR
ncbi:MAG: Calx-beta domain-containing protein [Pirellulales bacterium]